MQKHQTTLLAAIILAASAFGCVNPDKVFDDFDERVFDAGKPALGSGCMGGAVPDVSGEFYMALKTTLNPDAPLLLIVTSEIDLFAQPNAIFKMTLQPLCTWADAACTPGQPEGDPFVVDEATVDENCNFEVTVTGINVPGGANSISGSDLVGNLTIKGNLQTTDFFCGGVDGTAVVGGADIGVDNSTFGALRVAAGTLGQDLPDAILECPPTS